MVALVVGLAACATTEEKKTEPADEPAAQSHTVAAGDTLYAVAFRYGLDYRELAQWNDVKPPKYTIYVGQRLTLTAPGQQEPAKQESAKRAAPVAAATSSVAVVDKSHAHDIAAPMSRFGQPVAGPAPIAAAEPKPAAAPVQVQTAQLAPPEPLPAPIPLPVAEPKPAPAPKPAVVEAKPAAEPKPAVAEVKPAPEPKPAVVEAKPAPEPKPAVAEVKPAPEPKPAVAEVKPAPEPKPAVVEVKPAPTPEPKPVAENKAAAPEPKPAVAEAKPTPETKPAPAAKVAQAKAVEPKAPEPKAPEPKAPEPKAPEPKAPEPKVAPPPVEAPATVAAAESTTSIERADGTPVEADVSGWVWPTQGKVVAGYEPGSGRKGVDIGGTVGQPVHAAAGGEVVYSGKGLIGYGNLVIIRHNGEYLSAYGHNSRLLVKEGDHVDAGQKIAEMGQTAKTGSILHFEIRQNGKPVNPVKYLQSK